MALTIGGGITIGGQVTITPVGAEFTLNSSDITYNQELYGGYSSATSTEFVCDGNRDTWNGIVYDTTQGLHDSIVAAWTEAGFNTTNAYAWNVTWADTVTIATNSDGGLGGWSSQACSVAYDPAIISTYHKGGKITFSNGTTATITQIDDYGPTYIDIFWDTPLSGNIFPITLTNASIARVAINPDNIANSLGIVPIDQSNTNWQSGSLGGPTQAGTYTFPAVFTPYTPTTQIGNQNNWC